jgi:hypothetical protein
LDFSIFSFSSEILLQYSCSRSYAHLNCTRKALILSSFFVRSCNFSFASSYSRFFRAIISFFSVSHCRRDYLRVASHSVVITVCLLFISLRASSYFLSRSSSSYVDFSCNIRRKIHSHRYYVQCPDLEYLLLRSAR